MALVGNWPRRWGGSSRRLKAASRRSRPSDLRRRTRARSKLFFRRSKGHSKRVLPTARRWSTMKTQRLRRLPKGPMPKRAKRRFWPSGTASRFAAPSLRGGSFAGSTRLADAYRALVPGAVHLAHQRRVDDPVAERFDQGHVGLAEGAAGLDVDGHPALVAAVVPLDPGQVPDGVDGLVRNLGGGLAVEAVEGNEGEGAEVEVPGGAAQVGRETIAQGGLIAARDRQRAGRFAVDRSRDLAEVEPGAEAVAEVPEEASWPGFRLGRVKGGGHVEQVLEVIGAAPHGQCPDVFQGEVGNELVDAPGAAFLLGVRELHRGPPSIRCRMDRTPPACICQYGAV